MITEKDFENIKKLYEMGLKTKQVVEITGRSSSTVTFIKRSETLKDYHNLIQKYTMKNKTTPVKDVVEEPKIESKIQYTTNENRLAEALERIATTLEAMEVHWRPVEGKKFKLF